MEKKNKTAKVAKTKERRISNKKVESLHKYWEVFPGLKEKLIVPVEGENYSLIMPKDVRKAVLSSKIVEKTHHSIGLYSFVTSDMLFGVLNERFDDSVLEETKQMTKREMRRIAPHIPFVNRRKMLSDIDRYWPLVEEYHNTFKDGGQPACKKHPLFTCYMKFSVAQDMYGKNVNETLHSQYVRKLYSDFLAEKGKYVSLPDERLWAIEKTKEYSQGKEDLWKPYEESVMTEVNKRIENLDYYETNRNINMAFIGDISFCIQTQFEWAIFRLIDKLSA